MIFFFGGNGPRPNKDSLMDFFDSVSPHWLISGGEYRLCADWLALKGAVDGVPKHWQVFHFIVEEFVSSGRCLWEAIIRKVVSTYSKLSLHLSLSPCLLSQSRCGNLSVIWHLMSPQEMGHDEEPRINHCRLKRYPSSCMSDEMIMRLIFR